MAQEDERATGISKWKDLYGELLRISEGQRTVLNQMSADDQFEARMSRLEESWRHTQAEIMQLEAKLQRQLGREEYRAQFDLSIRPLIEQIQETIRKTTAHINHVMEDAGVVMRSVQDHKVVRQAYGDAEQDTAQSLFIDEKK